MPSRKDVFTNNQHYHIFDKTLDGYNVFADLKIWDMFLGAMKYYSYKAEVSFSDYRRMKDIDRVDIEQSEMIQDNKFVNIECHMGMPNHYHFILKQLQQGGIVMCMGKALNSITRYYNRRRGRKGPIFLPRFCSVSILSTYQLKYASKYIHLNPWKAGLVDSFQELVDYPTSSLGVYMGVKKSTWLKAENIMSHFNYSPAEYKKYLIRKGSGN